MNEIVPEVVETGLEASSAITGKTIALIAVGALAAVGLGFGIKCLIDKHKAKYIPLKTPVRLEKQETEQKAS